MKKQAGGDIILYKSFDNSLWVDFILRLLIDQRITILKQRPAKNIGLAYSYLVEKSFGLESLDVNHVEIVYPNVVYDAFGNVITNPVHTIVPEAFPGKAEWMTCSNFIPSGMRGFLECFFPPITAKILAKRRQQTLALIGILRKFEKY